MGKIFWNKKEIPQPEGAHIDSTDGRVFVYLDEGKPIRYSRKITIGHATSQTMMHPNETYKQMYPARWREYYGERELKPQVLHCGMYALTLGAAWQIGLYPILVDVYGPQNANHIMDYAMYSILHHSNVAQTFAGRMEGEVLFSRVPADEGCLSRLFREEMTEENNRLFLNRWMDLCTSRKQTGAWISIDGSNNDCNVQNADIAEKGTGIAPSHTFGGRMCFPLRNHCVMENTKAKSLHNGRIVSYMYAVDAEGGMPIAYRVYNGGRPDSKAIQTMAQYLNSRGVAVEGVILDRGFCTHDVVSLLNGLEYPWVIMLKSDTHAHQRMMLEHGAQIHWNVEHLVGENGLFGMAGRQRLFQAYPEEACVSLFFDGKNGSERAITLLNKVYSEAKGLEEELEKGNSPEVSRELKKYLKVERNPGKQDTLRFNYEKWQEDIDGKGFSSIASSIDLRPGEANRVYHLRDVSETQYTILKTQLGNNATRVHSQEGIMGKFAACFVAAVIRSVILGACRKKALDTNRMIVEIDRMQLFLNNIGMYAPIHDESGRQKELLSMFDIIPSDFDSIAGDINGRIESSTHSQIRMKPSHDHQGVKTRRGRPVGSGKKSRPETEPETGEAKRGRGRPKGSLNKKTIEKKRLEIGQADLSDVKRKPGRPKGSLNKPKEQSAPVKKRGRGRPKGSKNRPK